MPTRCTAHYFDGRTTTRHRVTITVAPMALQLLTSDGEIKQWPYNQIRQTQGAYSGEPVRLEFGPEPAESVVISTSDLLTSIHKAAPAMHNTSTTRHGGGLAYVGPFVQRWPSSS